MNLHGEMSGSVVIFLGQQFVTDDEVYNFYYAYRRNKDFGVRKKGIDESRRPSHEVICRKYCCNKEGVKKLAIKRQEGLSVNRHIDTRVQCPAVMHVRLHLFADGRFWIMTKFTDSHSRDLSSPYKLYQFYSH